MHDRMVDRTPGDGGLSGLGLIMQGVGLTFFWLAAYAVVVLLLMPGKVLGVPLAIAVLSVPRSWLHYQAGKKVADGHPRAVWSYIWAALVHSVVVVALVLTQGIPRLASVGLLSGLLVVWPVIAWAIARRSTALASAAPGARLHATDRGLTGLALMMTALGLVGCGVMGLVIINVIASGRGLGGVISGMILLVLLARSVVHAQAGLRLLRNFDPVGFQDDRDRYFVFGAISTGVFAVLLLIAMLGSASMVVFFAAFPTAGVMMAWPIIARHFGAIALEDWADEDLEQPTLTLAADGGLTTLGVALLGGGAVTLSFYVLTWLNPWSAQGLAQLPLAGWGGASTLGSGTLMALMTAWVGWELFTMSARIRWVSVVYVITLTALGLWQAYTGWTALDGILTREPMVVVLLLGGVLVPLIVPIVVAIQVRRLPSAEALSPYSDVF